VSTFLTADWRDLVAFSFEAPRSALEPFLPAGLSLDEWNGRTLVSILGFRFLDTCLLGCPIPFHRNFPEVNLRFYVRRETPDGFRRGVVFLRELVPKAAVAWLARTMYRENYVRIPIAQSVDPDHSASYGWGTGTGQSRIAAQTALPPSYPDPASLESFLLEHHWGYTRMPDGGCVEYEVKRPVWRNYPVASSDIQMPAESSLMAGFGLAVPAHPGSVIFAEGSSVSVSFGTRVA